MSGLWAFVLLGGKALGVVLTESHCLLPVGGSLISSFFGISGIIKASGA